MGPSTALRELIHSFRCSVPILLSPKNSIQIRHYIFSSYLIALHLLLGYFTVFLILGYYIPSASSTTIWAISKICFPCRYLSISPIKSSLFNAESIIALRMIGVQFSMHRFNADSSPDNWDLRGSLEIAIRDLKQHFGFSDYQSTPSIAIARFVQLCCTAFGIWKLMLLPENASIWLDDVKPKAI